MTTPCVTQLQKSTPKKRRKEDENSGKCKFKINTPLIFESRHMGAGKKLTFSTANETNFRSNNLTFNQNLATSGKLKFQCHYEERKRRAELRRKKIIQNLKKNYQINVEGFNEDVTREIIRKFEQIEKEKKEKERRNIDRTVAMITRLLEEQKHKNRGTRSCGLLWRRTLKKAPKTICTEEFDGFETACVSETAEQSQITVKNEENVEKPTKVTQSSSKEEKKFLQEEEVKKLPKCVEDVKDRDYFQADKVKKPKRSRCASTEQFLESSPKRIVFQDYEKGQVYFQDLKITNIGSETIHCRYLGIVVHTKTEERFPVGVAVRDNVKLRPGLSCSTKIRLCSQDDTKELQGSVVYETRRENKPSKYSWFFVQVVCLPVRAAVEVIPSKIIFPSFSWYEATDSKNIQQMTKIVRLKNTGKKACSCKIYDERPKSRSSEGIIEEAGEMEECVDTMSTFTKSDKEKEPEKKRGTGDQKIRNRSKNSSTCEEFFGEDFMNFWAEALDTSTSILDELIDNVFDTFRFCPKYYIGVPPLMTIQVEVRFNPQYQGFHHKIFIIKFENCDNCEEQRIEIQGDVKKMPITAEPQMIDLKICVANSGVYAGTFKIFNETKGPYSVFLKVPSAIKRHAHVYPRKATLLPRKYSDFSVRVYPRVTLAIDAPSYYKEDSKVLEFPVLIYAANVGGCKKDRIKIYVFALITDYFLQLSPASINFGTVTTLETVRAEMELTNHSLAIQEYGFLNLPKGVRVEPNMGFGQILPQETIKLYLLYSPGEELIECQNPQNGHEFKVEVTSIAKYGGFKEKLEIYEESTETWGEDYGYELPPFNENSFTNDPSLPVQGEDYDDFDVCEEHSSDEDEEIFLKMEKRKKQIWDFIKEDREKQSELSFFKRMDVHARDEMEHSKSNVVENLKGSVHEIVNEEAEESRVSSLKDDVNTIKCRAFITRPRCRLSESVIQLPATPCSSFSLYRFRLHAINESGDESCSCGFRKLPKKCLEKPNFKGSFEFQYICPHIKLEPECGVFKPGDSLLITIILRPEFPADQLRQKSRMKKAEKVVQKKKSEKETPKTGSKQSKAKPVTSKAKSDIVNENALGDIMSSSIFELENCDLFAGERSLQELINPFFVETKIRCIVKTIQCGSEIEKTEIHEMVLVCPAIKPNFIYLGTSQEIKFNKVLVGTRSRIILQAQNISFERICPSATFLNPMGPFHCYANGRNLEVDPEHIWLQPLVYAPLESKGVEKQFFELYYNSTNLFLTVSGEGIEPEFKITPNFVSCQMIAKLGATEELKIEIENLSVLKLNLIIKTQFVKHGPDQTKDEKAEEDTKGKKSGTPRQGESKDSKKSKNNVQFWEEVADVISEAMENLVDIKENEVTSKVFALAGVGNNNEIAVPPSGKQQFKIQFTPPLNKSGVNYIVKYILMLEGVSPLKEMLVMGKISKGK